MPNHSATEISVVVPAFNEAAVIEGSIKTIKNYFEKNRRNFELIVVSDGSSDHTADIAKQHDWLKLIDYSPNRGKGYAVRQGIHAASGKYIIYIDADLAIPIENIEKALPLLEKNDIVIGSKYHENAVQSEIPFYRKFMGKTFAVIVRMLSGLEFHDSQCGFKVFKNSVAKDIFSRATVDGWCFDVELLFLAAKRNYKVLEMPVNISSGQLQSKIKIFRSSLEMLADLVKIRLNEMRGLYK